MNSISTRERAGPYDAIETAKPGEPLFPLQGGDPFAPACVMHWAGSARNEANRLSAAALDERSKGKRSKLLDEAKHLRMKATNAEEVAWAMQAYQRDGAPTIAGPTVSYSGIEPDANRGRISILSGIADRIYNSIAEMTDAADALEKQAVELELQPGSISNLRSAVAFAKEAVAIVEPRRHLQREAVAG